MTHIPVIEGDPESRAVRGGSWTQLVGSELGRSPPWQSLQLTCLTYPKVGLPWGLEAGR